MERARRKELIEQWKHRRPEMGILSLRCKATGESFLGASTDLPAVRNGLLVRLNGGIHPNRKLLSLWREYGEEGFEWSVLQQLEYKDDTTEYRQELEKLRELYLEQDPKASKIWK